MEFHFFRRFCAPNFICVSFITGTLHLYVILSLLNFDFSTRTLRFLYFLYVRSFNLRSLISVCFEYVYSLLTYYSRIS
jgi:hypothetical protein